MAETNASPKPNATSIVPAPDWADRLSIIKDVVGIVQNVFAVAALILGGIWFYLQRPFAPVVKATVSASATAMQGGGYLIVESASFENVGHVPFKSSCKGIGVSADKDEYPRADCSSPIILKPGERRDISQLVVVPNDKLGDASFARALIGEVESGVWDASAPRAIQVLMLNGDTGQNGSVTSSTDPQNNARTPSPIQSGNGKTKDFALLHPHPTPTVQKLLKQDKIIQIPLSAQRTPTPNEIEEAMRKYKSEA